MQSPVMALVLLLFILPVCAHVVDNFLPDPKTKEQKCNQFFYNGFVPQWKTPNNYRHICQTFSNQPHFATLYDTANRIPVYSAYVVENLMKGGSDNSDVWLVEPQLVDNNYGNNMMTQAALMNGKHININQVGQNQAVEQDYAALDVSINNIRYNRGHLNPTGHHTGDGSSATNTLTNIVPQHMDLNGGQWLTTEKDRNDPASRGLTTYVLVGAVPSSNNWVMRDNMNRVNIPDYIWAAHCYKNTGGKKAKFPICHAVVAKNDDNKVYKLNDQNDLDRLNNLLNLNSLNRLSGPDALSHLQDFLNRQYTGSGQICLFDQMCYKPDKAGGGGGSGPSGSGGSPRRNIHMDWI
ncbi:endonuclease domain-containing 1 protein-like [Pholidichthys leucotaenia]